MIKTNIIKPMEINYYIKQILIFREKLYKWDVYLKELHKNVLSSEKSSIRILELNDRKELIKCENLEKHEIYDELKKIYNVIDQERIIYVKLCDLILNPTKFSMFTLKSVAKGKRDDKIKTLFNQLFEINKEQKVRIDFFLKSLKLLAVEDGQTVEVATRNQKSIPLIEIKNLKGGVFESQTNNASDDKVKLVLKDNVTVLSENTQEPELIVEKNNDLKEINDDTSVVSNIPSDVNDEFDYESEVKRLLGL